MRFMGHNITTGEDDERSDNTVTLKEWVAAATPWIMSVLSIFTIASMFAGNKSLSQFFYTHIIPCSIIAVAYWLYCWARE